MSRTTAFKMMMKHKSHSRTIILGLLASLTITGAQHGSTLPVGLFTSHTDVGQPALRGSAIYDPEQQRYTISGAGKNMWFGLDEFHFAWKRLKGDFIVQTRAVFPDRGVDAHRKLGWMARSTLETGSPHMNPAVHGDGLTSLQFRRTAGAKTEELKSIVAYLYGGQGTINVPSWSPDGRHAAFVSHTGQ